MVANRVVSTRRGVTANRHCWGVTKSENLSQRIAIDCVGRDAGDWGRTVYFAHILCCHRQTRLFPVDGVDTVSKSSISRIVICGRGITVVSKVPRTITDQCSNASAVGNTASVKRGSASVSD